jgi:phage repressor protein C with HTH and peptisase S24 domain
MARQQKPQKNLTHEQIWNALDRLAANSGLSPSALARRSGLDPTTFNRSKRITADGRERWPSTESVAKALAAVDQSIDHFVALMGNSARPVRAVPLLSFALASQRIHFDDGGFPAGRGWDEMALPAIDDDQIFALEISGDALKPAYRNGDIILVSQASPIRRGDRVVVKTRNGEVMIKELKRLTARVLELASPNPAQSSAQDERTLAASDIEWIARIVWARQ